MMRTSDRGYAGLEKLAALMNLTRPVTQNNCEENCKTTSCSQQEYT